MFNWNEKSEKKGEKKISAIRAKALHLAVNEPQEKRIEIFDSELIKMDLMNPRL
jgi:hypothetical protein